MYNKLIEIFVLVFIILCTVSWTALIPSCAKKKDVVGYIEKVKIFPGELMIRAKLDTGAKISSVDAQDVNTFKRGGQRWVRFTVTNHEGEVIRLERKILRTIKIKRKKLKPQERLVVSLGICLKNTYKEVEVNLVDRDNFKYQMLVGRSFLHQNFIIDPSASFTSLPQCDEEDNL